MVEEGYESYCLDKTAAYGAVDCCGEGLEGGLVMCGESENWR